MSKVSTWCQASSALQSENVQLTANLRFAQAPGGSPQPWWMDRVPSREFLST
jgi:hypothetical protein